MKRGRRETKKLKVSLGRVYRDIRRKSIEPGEFLGELLCLAERILQQQKNDHQKVYIIHAPEVECVSKGKVHKQYEFGCTVSLVKAPRSNWVLAVDSIHGNPYNGHTLGQLIH